MDTRRIVSADKIFLDPMSLLPRIEKLRRQGKTIVFANGCFELLHVGHVRYLEAAKALGDVLILAVNTDASMLRIKPDRRPVNTDYERFEILAAFAAVDFIVPLEEDTPVSLLELFRPHIHTKGTDYTLDRIPERAAVEAYGGRVELVGGPKSHSTRDMLKTLGTRGPLS
ncbi:MAG: adenylyltransferase/cytidyltransferase family protein [Planctomycetes bacterium]|nr:adenylyltransferase/cytidyltransferase family protein [Planctomycetota bacterium]